MTYLGMTDEQIVEYLEYPSEEAPLSFVKEHGITHEKHLKLVMYYRDHLQ